MRWGRWVDEVDEATWKGVGRDDPPHPPHSTPLLPRPAGYLTDLNSIKISTEAEIGDIKKVLLRVGSILMSFP